MNMKEAIEGVLFILAVLVFVVFLPLMGLWRLRVKRNKKLAAESDIALAQFEQRQRQPSFAAFEKKYGCQPPPPLQKLYGDAAAMLDGNFDLRFPSLPNLFFIAWFEPMDDKHISFAWHGTEGFYSFANDGCDNQYLVSPHEADPMVYFFDHETGEREPVVKLSEFIAARHLKEESD